MKIYVLAFVLGICLAGRALAEGPLFEQDPFDQVTLDEDNGGAVLKVKPLDLPDRRLPAKPDPDANLVIRLVDQPDKKYEVAWKSIRKVELFEQRLLDKAKELVAADSMDEAYNYFRFLEENYSQMSGLSEAHDEFLFKQAKAFFGKQQYRNALGVLRELHRHSPQRAKLDNAMGGMTEKLIEQYAATADYASIRALLRSLVACYPNHPLVAKWETRLKDESAAGLADAQRARQSGDLSKAAATIRRVELLWPTVSGAKELAEAIHKEHPRVIVGVCQAAPDRSLAGPGDGLEPVCNWAARRDARLVSRALSELTAAGRNGGQYACPFGAVKTDETGRRLTIALNHDAGLSGCDVARGLLAMADRDRAACRPEWAEIFAAVTVHDAYQVDIELGESHLRPQAFLAMPLLGEGQVANLPETEQIGNLPYSGPYARAAATATEAVFVLNPRYFARTPTQPREIVERTFADAAAGVAALRRGDIQVLDRLDPWQVKSLRANDSVTVQSYALPRLHCLVPNARKPLLANRTFRRALAYGIDRQAVLGQLLRGDTLPGCVLLHGPMQMGTSTQDPLNYASDPGVMPWPYDPRLALALAEGGRRELAAGDKGPTSPSGPSLVLAYPADDIARVACQAIRQQLAAADIAVELKELPAAPGQIPADVDLLYAELAMWEPLVDAPRVLGENGLARACSGQMSDALRQLQQAADWNLISACLRRIDRLAHDEIAVVPLWQLPDYFAYRKNLAGIEKGTVTLYQNVEQWEPGFQYPSEK